MKHSVMCIPSCMTCTGSRDTATRWGTTITVILANGSSDQPSVLVHRVASLPVNVRPKTRSSFVILNLAIDSDAGEYRGFAKARPILTGREPHGGSTSLVAARRCAARPEASLSRSSCYWGTRRPDDRRYLGTKQDLVHAPNDGIKLRVAV